MSASTKKPKAVTRHPALVRVEFLQAKVNEQNERIDQLTRERDALREKLKAADDYTRTVKTKLGTQQKIAEWANVPDTVAEAVRVAAHLGRVVIFTLRAPERSYSPMFGAMVDASEQLPAPGPTLDIYAAERVA